MPQTGKPPCDDAVINAGAVACSAAAKRGILADAFQAQWVVESYALFLASLLLVGAVLALSSALCAWRCIAPHVEPLERPPNQPGLPT